MVAKARCVHCRADISIPDTYAHGDHIKCGACHTQHKVVRGGEAIRLVLADVGPLKDAYLANQVLVERLNDELRAARGSFGIGANGFGLGVAYFLWQVAFQDVPPDTTLITKAVMVGVGSGVFLEVANFLFLAKRKKMKRLSQEIDEAEEDGRAMQKKIREAQRM
jgi:hypothetical protein